MNGIIDFLQDLFVVKAPALPEGLKSFIVKVLPYLMVVVAIFAVLALIAAVPALLAVGAFVGAGFALGGILSLVAMVLGLVAFVLALMAIPGLFKRTRTAWIFLVYAELIIIVMNVVDFSIVNIIVAIISLYILFQIRSYYNGAMPVAPMGPSPMQSPPGAGGQSF